MTMLDNPSEAHHLKEMPSSFSPGAFTVICGRGKSCTTSPGNCRLRGLVNRYMAQYSSAETKMEKTTIVSTILEEVKKASPEAAFVKKEKGGIWWEVDDSFAREKIGGLFREALHAQYKSSTKSKIAKKKLQELKCTSNEKLASLQQFSAVVTPPPPPEGRDHHQVEFLNLQNYQSLLQNYISSSISPRSDDGLRGPLPVEKHSFKPSPGAIVALPRYCCPPAMTPDLIFSSKGGDTTFNAFAAVKEACAVVDATTEQGEADSFHTSDLPEDFDLDSIFEGD